MSFLSILKRTAPVATAALSVYNPMLGAVASQILLAENVIPGEKKGPEKKAFVLNSFAGMTPFIIPMIEQAMGKDVVDDDKFSQGLSDLIDAIVTLNNSLKPLQK